jgi:hypothetical protein
LSLEVEAQGQESTNAAVSGKTPLKIPPRAEDIATIHTDFGPEGGGEPAFELLVFLFTIPPVVFLVSLLVWWQRKKRFKAPEQRASRAAYRTFIRALSSLKNGGRKKEMVVDSLLAILRDFLGNRFFSYGQSMTSHDVVSLLAERGISTERAEELKKIMAGLEEAQYGIGLTDIDLVKLDSLKKIVREIDRQAKYP